MPASQKPISDQDSSQDALPVEPASKNKGGAPPGNHNAFKHGFYSQLFSRSEKARLDQGVHGELVDEETLLRTLIFRTGETMKGRQLSHEEAVVALRAVALAIGRIESLHRSRRVIYENQTSLEKALEELKYILPEED
jgi:uncharacterized protein YjcR